jgi:gluconate 2-dehydrogenase gamma chain
MPAAVLSDHDAGDGTGARVLCAPRQETSQRRAEGHRVRTRLPVRPGWRILIATHVIRRSQQAGEREEHMSDQGFGRRDFLKGAVVGGAAAATGIQQPQSAQAQQPAAAASTAAASPEGYAFLNIEEAAFVETLVDHMVPADDLTPKGTDLGIAVYIDRALAGAWGKGDRLYMQGPWKQGAPSQGYQLPLTPAQLYRAGIEATNAHCRKTYGKAFDRIDETQRQEVMVGLATGKVTFDSGLPARVFWTMVYQTVMEGMFSDPIYGGNRNKAGWRLIGFPGAIAVHRENVEKYRDKEFPTNPVGIADMS